MFEELAKLSKTLGFVAEPESKKIIDIVNGKLADMLEAHIIDVLWKEEAKQGDLLRQFTCVDKTSRGPLKPYLVRPANDASDTAPGDQSERHGIWTWAYSNNKPIWLENIRNRDLNESILNKATDEEIDPSYLEFSEDTDSIMVIPLSFRGIVWGVYSIELPKSGKFKLETLDLMKRLAEPIATIIWKADTQTLNQQQTNDAIRLFSEALRNQELVLTPYKTGFIARPFDQGFNEIENCISKYLEKEEIQAAHYSHIPGRGIVINEIMQRIRNSHFGIVDITGLNHNVVLELGMMMVLDKKFLLLRRDDDDTPQPFDLVAYHFYEYRNRGQEIAIRDPGSDRFESSVEDILHRFVDEEVSFQGARPWRP